MRADLANTKSSRKLDKMIKQARKDLKQDFSGYFVVRTKIYENAWAKYFNLKPQGIGCEPDGGLWYYNGKLVAVFEGKSQGDTGNADERWWKNASICSTVFDYYNNISGIYYTFASGIGCRKKWKGNEELSSVCFKQDFRWCLNENGFEYEDILQGMRNTLNEILGKNHKPHVYPTLRGVLPNV